ARCEKQVRAAKDALIEASRLRSDNKGREAHDAVLRALDDYPWIAKTAGLQIPFLVESAPTGAQVTVDGRPADGTTPVTVDLPLAPATLTVMAQNREHVSMPASPLSAWSMLVRLPRQRTWSVPEAPGSSAPALAEGLVVATCDDRSAVAVDRDSGAVRWRTPLGIFDDSDLPPVVVSGTVFVRTNQGTVIGLELASGKELWRREVRPPPLDVSDPAAGRPVAAPEGAVVRDGPQGLVLLGASDGAVRWTASAKGPITGAPLALAKNVLAVSGRTVFAFKVATGAPAFSAALPLQAVLGPVAGPRGTAVVALESGALAWIDDSGTVLGTDKVLPAGISAVDGGAAIVV
ncbi:MAG TPA: PQQ-binding-like beta-propeller repeat protein, partial [Acidimicrobiales bacterium]|nr:PQQ-binding-like beta-propeller repeat protein [Acidimicrobiales bacterium]